MCRNECHQIAFKQPSKWKYISFEYLYLKTNGNTAQALLQGTLHYKRI